ncbi:hypothetical protein ACFY8W_13535 [Streptomyces sp. NPDC012637]|uniref:hypothetical protein n=1 Tax=Streptomyces sp. NPDC012637 TaxID=3364842 RepID=UPI0036E6623F
MTEPANVKDIVHRLFRDRLVEYLSESPIGCTPAPALYEPAAASERVGLEARSEVAWDDGYREFLAITDGMNGFHLSILGVKDWGPDGPGEAAARLLEDSRDIGLHLDEGIPEGVPLFPVALNSGHSVGVFMGDIGSGARYWLIGEGDSSFFDEFVDVLTYLGGERRNLRDSLV